MNVSTTTAAAATAAAAAAILNSEIIYHFVDELNEIIMNSKESGNKKDKLSSKEKRLAVPAVVNNKEPTELPICSSKGVPVKLRRRESGKVAPANEPVRKSVVSRYGSQIQYIEYYYIMLYI